MIIGEIDVLIWTEDEYWLVFLQLCKDMFRKKDQPELAEAYVLNGRYVKVEPSKRGGYVEYSREYGYMQGRQLGLQGKGISEIDISESYLTDGDEKEFNQRKQDADKLNKSNRRKIPFLQKKKKQPPLNSNFEQRSLDDTARTGVDDEADDDDDISDITTYDEGIPVVYEGLKKNGLHQLGMNQASKRLDLDQQYAEEAQIFERMNFIIDNYRQPPAYPGEPNIDSSEKSMIQQLLQEKASRQMKDNASMINYCQVDAPKELSMEDLTKILRASHVGALDRPVDAQLADAITSNAGISPYQAGAASAGQPVTIPDPITIRKADQLVMRTLCSPRTPEAARASPGSSVGACATPPDPGQVFEFRNTRPTAELVSEIYPRDYDPDYDNDSADELERGQESTPDQISQIVSDKEAEEASQLNASCSVDEVTNMRPNYVVDVMPSYRDLEESEEMKPYVMPPDYNEHPERDYDIGKGDFDILPENFNSQMQNDSLLVHYREKSETFVPPSPYMNAEIPEWLQVYAKASPEHDEYLKWDMFRPPELDCWQTMLKRLYMKELEQVVFWFEEYRQAMQQELEKRENEMGIMRVKMPVLDSRMKKTDV